MFPDLYTFAVAIAFLVLIQLKVADRRFLIPISIFIVLLLACPSLSVMLDLVIGYKFLWATYVIGLLSFYLLRFRAKGQTKFSNWLKVSAIVSFCLCLTPTTLLIDYWEPWFLSDYNLFREYLYL